MHAPLYSTITLFTELIISGCIYYVLYHGYKHTIFKTKIAAFALLYETLFNISYMVSQVPEHQKAARVESGFIIALAITHGILSLAMFLSLIIFFIFAWRGYKKKINFFATHKMLTTLFLIFWTFSILSGIIFYIVEYVL